MIRDISLRKKASYIIPEIDFFDKRHLIIENFFEANYNTNKTIHDLAKMLNVSVRQLDRIIQDSFKMSFKNKIIEKRMEISKNLLRNTKLPVKTIAERVGYNTESNFYKVFKQKNGHTPAEYRKKYKTS
ncbi:MAG: helix-turn-helix transcriptional regulator [Clostridiaceae bacterium]|nr:helix-turn-helix transcriptional regulator [Clostridiaceae bacterium]